MSLKKYTLTFPDGLVIPDFQWTVMGWYTRRFPDSGIHSEEVNSLDFTRDALKDGGIDLVESPVIAGEPQFVAVVGSHAIMQGHRHVATATSHNMAKRIARALNLHKTNERGY